MYNTLWHPHQKLWNKRLMRLINKNLPHKRIREIVKRLIIYLDTFILAIRLKSFYLNKTRCRQKITHINYFDLGIHKEAAELNWVLKQILQKQNRSFMIYGFEANPFTYKQVLDNIPKVKNLQLYNYAIINNKHPSGKIKLYTSKNGLSDSIYRSNYDNYVEVPAIKLSDFIYQKHINLSKSVNILRMNIEGAEFDVLQDLINEGLIKYFHRFYGMWDDVSKIDHAKDIQFRKTLKEHNIKPVPLNGRDLQSNARLKIIKKDFNIIINNCL